jgi:release factor glutamine methyltransferase
MTARDEDNCKTVNNHPKHTASMRILDLLKSSSDYLEKAGIDDPLADAEMLVFHAAGTDRLDAYLNNQDLGRDISSRIRRLLKRRAKGEPVQYIIGSVEFLGLKIHVGKGVLIPRPETELLAQEAIRQLRRQETGDRIQNNSPFTICPSLKILDLCTGSGCLALALAREFPGSEVWATDISKTAIRYAKKNAVANRLTNVRFLQGSLFETLNRHPVFDLIISNPPYIRTGEIGGLQREIRDWEPAEALDGGEDGLNFYRRIFSGAGKYLKEGGGLVLELGYDQAGDVSIIAQEAGFKNISIIKDYAGIGRILKANIRIQNTEFRSQ